MTNSEEIEAAAKALYLASRDPFPRPWTSLAQADRDVFRQHAKTALEAARVQAGGSL
jgi:hypothetical protein